MPWNEADPFVYDTTASDYIDAVPKVRQVGGLWAPSIVKISDGKGTEPPEPPDPPTTSFPGDPGKGYFYMGEAPDWRQLGDHLATAVGLDRAIKAGNARISDYASYVSRPNWYPHYTTSKTRKMRLVRSYNGLNPIFAIDEMETIIDNGAIPNLTWKGDPAAVVAGSNDANLTKMANAMKAVAPWPIWLTYWHEPEDDHSSRSAALAYRNACRYNVNFFRDAGVTNFANVAVHYMCNWTWNAWPSSGRNGWRWYPDLIGDPDAMWGSGTGGWNPGSDQIYTGEDSVVDIIGMDHYTQWRPAQGLNQYLTNWKSKFNQVRNRINPVLPEAKPYCIGETDWVVYSSTGGDNNQDVNTYDQSKTVQFLDDLLPYFATADIRGVEYFNTSESDSPSWETRLLNYDDAGIRYQMYAKWQDDSRSRNPVAYFDL